MPFGDRTGPLGRGPRTGRGAGYCSGYPVPGFLNPTPGFGFWGRGRGWRHMFWATGLPGWARFGYPGAPTAPGYDFFPAEATSDEEKEILKGQAESLKRALEEIEKRLQELEKEEK
ncbi:DUF5320 domain-containing protein [bacterium]|nr:DUF5320 domain-containing protein [bacterium]